MLRNLVFVLVVALLALAKPGFAGERKFGFSYEAEVLPEDSWEAELGIKHENGHKDGDYAKWNVRPEIEYGLSESLQTALYLNLESERSEGLSAQEDSSDTDFKGVSTEWQYQLVNPVLNPVGLALYTEYTTDGIDQEWENKILVSKDWDNWSAVFNAIYEAEWEKEGDEREDEATLAFTAGIARRIANGWTSGLEARQKSAYPDGINLSGQEFQAVNAGPVVHYAGKKLWATLAILPQIWGNGDGSSGNRQLVHEEKIEIQFLIGTHF